MTDPVIEIEEGEESDIKGDVSIHDSFEHSRAESTESMSIRHRAEEIYETYQTRLKRVGKARFQQRLNLFFSFVKPTSIEAEAYDFLQSVEGSVMNRSDDSAHSIMEKVFSRSQTLSQISCADIDYN